MLLDENKDEQILKEACLGLCQLFGDGIQNDRIQAILEADVVPRLVALLKPNRSRNVPVSVQAAALQVIGNVACGDDRQTQVIIDCDALPCLRVSSFEFVLAPPLTCAPQPLPL
jgi:importin subunit alpha-6/7